MRLLWAGVMLGSVFTPWLLKRCIFRSLRRVGRCEFSARDGAPGKVVGKEGIVFVVAVGRDFTLAPQRKVAKGNLCRFLVRYMFS